MFLHVRPFTIIQGLVLLHPCMVTLLKIKNCSFLYIFLTRKNCIYRINEIEFLSKQKQKKRKKRKKKYSIMDHLYGCFSYFEGLFQQLQDSTYNLTYFKVSFIVVFFCMVHNKKLLRRSNVNYRIFSDGPTRSDLFLLCNQKK